MIRFLPVSPSPTSYRERHYDQCSILRDMSTTYLNRLCLLALSFGVGTDFSRILRPDTVCREGGSATYHERPTPSQLQ